MMELTNKLSNSSDLSGSKKEDDNTETQELFSHRVKKVKPQYIIEKYFTKVLLLSL